MNYRHAFHAGNHADVLKHLIMTRLFALMARKEQPFAYIDSHAGLGLYDLKGDQASRTGEYLEGIARLWDAPDLPALAADYMQLLHDMNPNGELRYYPGSPEIARRSTRANDRVLL
ncbi:23S rRNA (adenine(2030)-N(6))-methyltransferase RlmJ, partial [Pseudomonas quasicaspiana]|nr:23S rRNA (adenine(2030)-N(6))-methyltransferase RlmJ [Pseudomonas quasicaspiana]